MQVGVGEHVPALVELRARGCNWVRHHFQCFSAVFLAKRGVEWEHIAALRVGLAHDVYANGVTFGGAQRLKGLYACPVEFVGAFGGAALTVVVLQYPPVFVSVGGVVVGLVAVQVAGLVEVEGVGQSEEIVARGVYRQHQPCVARQVERAAVHVKLAAVVIGAVDVEVARRLALAAAQREFCPGQNHDVLGVPRFIGVAHRAADYGGHYGVVAVAVKGKLQFVAERERGGECQYIFALVAYALDAHRRIAVAGQSARRRAFNNKSVGLPQQVLAQVADDGQEQQFGIAAGVGAPFAAAVVAQVALRIAAQLVQFVMESAVHLGGFYRPLVVGLGGIALGAADDGIVAYGVEAGVVVAPQAFVAVVDGRETHCRAVGKEALGGVAAHGPDCVGVNFVGYDFAVVNCAVSCRRIAGLVDVARQDVVVGAGLGYDGKAVGHIAGAEQ